MRPIVLTIAGFDPTAGAGVLADLKAIEANGGYATAAVSAVTVQNSRSTTRVEPLDGAWVAEQVAAVLDDLHPAAVKIGMLGSAAVVRAVARQLERHPRLPVVLDPVLATGDGVSLADESTVAALVDELLPRVDLVTPNTPEARRLAAVRGGPSSSRCGDAARRLRELGARAVLLTGGHREDARGEDLLLTAEGAEAIRNEWIDTPHAHGTGCVYASAIATRLARGDRLRDAVVRAREYLVSTLRHPLSYGGGGAGDPLHALHAASTSVGS